MNLRRRVGRLLGLAASVTLTCVGASWPLNPLVTRTQQPTAPVPPGCEESSLAPAPAPRVIVTEIPPPEEILPVATPPEAPPSRSLRVELEAAHRALARNNRPAFDEHLRAAREIVAAYPPGAERTRAEEVLWALNDAAVLWDAQFQSPFFDETSDAYARVSRYAGYPEAVRRSVLTDDDERRFYPAAESRDFITRIAAERLERLGIRSTAAPPPRVTRGETTSPVPRRATAPSIAPSTTPSITSSTTPSATASATSRPSSRRTTTSPRRSTRRSSSSIARSSKPAAPAAAVPSSSPDPSDAASPAPAEPAPTAPPASASQASADAPASPAAESTSPPAGVDVDPSAPAATDSATTTAAPATPEPATTTPAEAAERRSVFIPALLIAIGLLVLIVLFRASK